MVKDLSIVRVIFRALSLIIVIPALVIVYLFKENLTGKEVPLALILALSILGFYLLWSILNAVTRFQKALTSFAAGETSAIRVEDGSRQFREMADIIQALNRLSVELRENAKQLEGFIQQFATLAEFTEITAKMPEVDELLAIVLRRSMCVTHAGRGTIMILRQEDRVLDIIASEGWTPERAAGIPLHATLAGRVVETGVPLLIEDITKSDLISRPNDAGQYRSPSFLIMPLKAKNATLGAICLSEKTTGAAFNSHDQQFLTVLLGQVGFAVENSRLLKQARESAERLKVTVKDQEAQIKLARNRILQAEKLSALGQLAGGVAHDFNNIVQSILGYTELSQECLSPEDEPYAYLGQIRKAADRASALTAQLLAFGRRQLLQPVELNLNAAMADLMGMVNRLIGEHIEIEMLPAPDLGIVRADQRQIEQVLMNLCINARDAMKEGGKVTLRTRNLDIDEEGHPGFPMARPGRYILLSVTDTGCGMDEATLSQVFEPFFTTKEMSSGTGLGLATVYGIVRQHGGLIDVVSAIGKGTTFHVLLPRVQGLGAAAEKKAEDLPTACGKETILLAEDEEEVRNLGANFLRRAGYTVLTASDGEEAIEVFSRNSERISLAVLDAVMPRKGGREVAEEIRSRKPGVAILYSSGYSPDFKDLAGRSTEAAPLLQKPYQRSLLLSKVREVLDAGAAPPG